MNENSRPRSSTGYKVGVRKLFLGRFEDEPQTLGEAPPAPWRERSFGEVMILPVEVLMSLPGGGVEGLDHFRIGGEGLALFDAQRLEHGHHHEVPLVERFLVEHPGQEPPVPQTVFRSTGPLLPFRWDHPRLAGVVASGIWAGLITVLQRLRRLHHARPRFEWAVESRQDEPAHAQPAG